MAAGQNVPELGGYDYELTGKVPDYLECLVCQLPMRDPVQIVPCGHRLCDICKESLFRESSPLCPADRQPLSRDQIFPDTACRREIMNLIVKCSHFGCPWTGELRAVETHQSECLLKVVQCPNLGCTVQVTGRNMATHVTSECSWRKINCEYCQNLLVFNQRKKHFNVCKKFPVQCTNKCGIKEIPRDELEFHIDVECPATVVRCEFNKLGCHAKFPRLETKPHSETQLEHHLNLALHSLETTQHQVKDQSEQIKQLIAKDKDNSQQIERLMAKDKDNSQQIERLMAKDRGNSQQIERLTTQVKLQDQHIKCLNSPSFVWKISNFWAAYQRAVTGMENIITSTFYLSSNGYKLRIKVLSNAYMMGWPFNDLVSCTRSFSLYICVIPGEFDPLLSWPFKEKIRVTLFDQNPCRDEKKDIWRVTDFESLARPILRPHSEADANWHAVLGPFSEEMLQSASYILNDTIFIMVKKEWNSST
ncbi:TNF receptor-associated factor 6 [Stylophora pistillata]|uniref:TNF receptor-associated factor 6 n=3 Tax=Stylophora pistillata TaxID=50429 RepID=A0A2B4SDU2_STYPI|nr:TNF receptor-associated factor 6 [Stylophora pistillata]